MSVNKGRDFYKILGVDKRATTEQIEKAYKVLFNEMAISAKDDKHKDAVDKFEEVREAYMTLRSPDRRKAYDQKVTHTINLDQAYNIFESFFKQVGIQGQSEKEFFNQHYPGMPESPYEILGVPPDAPFPEIQKAYRTLVLKSHPKSTSTVQERHAAQANFLKITQAYKKLVSLNDEKQKQKAPEHKGGKAQAKAEASKTQQAAAGPISPTLINKLVNQNTELIDVIVKKISGQPDSAKAQPQKKVETLYSQQAPKPKPSKQEDALRSTSLRENRAVKEESSEAENDRKVGKQPARDSSSEARDRKDRRDSTSSISSRDRKPKATSSRADNRRRQNNRRRNQKSFQTSSESNANNDKQCANCGKDLRHPKYSTSQRAQRRGRKQNSSRRQQKRDRRDSTSSVSSQDRQDRDRRDSTSSVSSKDRQQTRRRQNRNRRDSTSSVSSRDRQDTKGKRRQNRDRRDSTSSVSSRDVQKAKKRQNRDRRDSTSSVSSRDRHESKGQRRNNRDRRYSTSSVSSKDQQNARANRANRANRRQQRDRRDSTSSISSRDRDNTEARQQTTNRRQNRLDRNQADRYNDDRRNLRRNNEANHYENDRRRQPQGRRFRSQSRQSLQQLDYNDRKRTNAKLTSSTRRQTNRFSGAARESSSDFSGSSSSGSYSSQYSDSLASEYTLETSSGTSGDSASYVSSSSVESKQSSSTDSAYTDSGSDRDRDDDSNSGRDARGWNSRGVRNRASSRIHHRYSSANRWQEDQKALLNVAIENQPLQKVLKDLRQNQAAHEEYRKNQRQQVHQAHQQKAQRHIQQPSADILFTGTHFRTEGPNPIHQKTEALPRLTPVDLKNPATSLPVQRNDRKAEQDLQARQASNATTNQRARYAKADSAASDGKNN